jgi:hypothetical protein
MNCHRVVAALFAVAGPLLGAGAQDVTVFRNVAVVPMDEERVLSAQTVVVRGDRIVSIGPAASAAVPDNARVIEGAGRYLTPGLAEMHAHVPSGDDPQYVEEVLFLYVANGVTTARGMLGEPSHLHLGPVAERQQRERRRVRGPTGARAGACRLRLREGAPGPDA